MTNQEYMSKLSDVRTSRLNQIIHAVNCKVPKSEVGLKSDVENRFYDSLIEQANEHVKKYGDWPVFEVGEIESDDPVLDIYGK